MVAIHSLFLLSDFEPATATKTIVAALNPPLSAKDAAARGRLWVSGPPDVNW